MNIVEALELFKVDNIEQESKETLKKKYKKLIIKYHPDNCNDSSKAQDIIEAYKIIEQAIKKMELFRKVTQKNDVITQIIELESLIKIYNGKEIIVSNKGKDFELNRKNVKRHNIFVESSIIMVLDGIEYRLSNIEPINMQDEYNISCSVYVKDVNDEVDIIIKTIDSKKINYTVKYNDTTIKIKVYDSIKINVNIKKKIRVEKN